MKYKIGYTQGVYDMFHVGHLNLLKRAKEQCDFLIVGVNSDELVEQYKHKKTVIGEKERLEIVSNIKAVDDAFLVQTLDKVEVLKHKEYNAIFIGSDWENTDRWIQTRKDLMKYGVEVVFLPYTEGVTSTELKLVKDNHIKE